MSDEQQTFYYLGVALALDLLIGVERGWKPREQAEGHRAQSLTVAGTVEFRMCRVAARGHGPEPDQIHGFVKVVPMADAKIVRLQQEEGYVYMH